MAMNTTERGPKKIVVETIEKANARRQRERERAAWRRMNETPEQTMLRRKKERERAAYRRRNEDPLQTMLRLKRDRERAAQRRREELPEQTQLRLKREREKTALRRRRKTEMYITAAEELQMEFNKEKKKIMAPFIQSELYEEKWTPVIDQISAASVSDSFCSSSSRNLSSNLSAISDNFLSVKPKFLSVLSEYSCMLMSNLAFFWKNGQYCDAAIEATNSKVLVHKLLLLAISPKLQFKVQIPSHSFMRVIFPHGVDKAGLDAFADYMYNGILSIDPGLLLQLQTIAQQLDIEELGLLCQNQLPPSSSNTKPNTQQTDSLISDASSNVSILFEENSNVKTELSSGDTFSRFCDSTSETVPIHQTFPSEKSADHLHSCNEGDSQGSKHLQNFQTAEENFIKKDPLLSPTLTLCSATFANETQIKLSDSFAQN